MAISDKIKALIKLNNADNLQIAQHLGISRQAFSNKLYRDSFSGADLIKIAEFLKCDLAFITERNQKIILEPCDAKTKKGTKEEI
ncbi:MAG: helix-turn-helix domain-containing protein [Clostridiales bacterium]